MKAFLDTHTAVAIYAGDRQVLGTDGREVLEAALVCISPIVRLELAFLHEIGRITIPADQIVGVLTADLAVVIARDNLDEIVALSLPLTWTRDPFDRLLVAHAQLHEAPFVTRDRKIRSHYDRAVW